MIKSVNITRVSELSDKGEDLVVIEEPMELRLIHGKGEDRNMFSLSVTMRTPGHDFELALGFLFTEGIIKNDYDVREIRYCESVKEEEQGNVVNVSLHEHVEIDEKKLQRHFYTTSSCGVCGKSSIESVRELTGPKASVKKGTVFTRAQITALPKAMKEEQYIFRHTGGIHAASLVDTKGNFIYVREDIGRHNAVDKVIGAALKEGKLPLEGQLLAVSGRAGFELVQKAVVAGIGTFVAVGAPSSLAVELAKQSGMTLIGFLRDGRFNIYCGAENIKVEEQA